MTWRIFFRPNNAGLNFLIAHEPEPDDLGSKSSSFKYTWPYNAICVWFISV